MIALMQQAELLSSLAIKVNLEKTDLSLESAWMVSTKSWITLEIILVCVSIAVILSK